MGAMIPKAYKDTPAGVIPADWKLMKVSSFATINTGGSDTQDKVENGTYPFFVRSQTVERINTYSFNGEAVLTSGDGVGVGKIFHYINGKFDYHQRVYNIHAFIPSVYGRYFYEYFKANFYNRVSRLSAKNSVDSVRMAMISDMDVAIPPLPEQKKIARILSTVDQKLELIDQQITATQTLKKGLMQKLFSEGVGTQDASGQWQPHTEFKDSIPAGWKRVMLSEIAEIRTGVAKGKKGLKDPVTLPYLRVANVKDGYLDLDEVKTLQIEKTQFDRYALKAGDVLMTEGGDVDKLGRGDVWHGQIENCLHQNHVFSVRCQQQVLLPKYLTSLTGSAYGKRYFMSCAKQTTNLASINSTQLKAFPVLLPPIEEQKEMAKILSTTDRKLEQLNIQKAQTEQLKKGLMQKLLTGQIRVKPEPQDH